MEDRSQLAVRIRGNLRLLLRDGAVPAHVPIEAGPDAATHLHELVESAGLLADLPLERAPTAVLAPVDTALAVVAESLDACRSLNARAGGPGADDLRTRIAGLSSAAQELHARLAALLGVLAHTAGDLPATRRRSEASLARAESLIAAGAAHLDDTLRRARAAGEPPADSAAGARDEGLAALAEAHQRRGVRWLMAAGGCAAASLIGAWLFAATGPAHDSWTAPGAVWHAAPRTLTVAIGLIAMLWCLRMHGACVRAAATCRARALTLDACRRLARLAPSAEAAERVLLAAVATIGAPEHAATGPLGAPGAGASPSNGAPHVPSPASPLPGAGA